MVTAQMEPVEIRFEMLAYSLTERLWDCLKWLRSLMMCGYVRLGRICSEHHVKLLLFHRKTNCLIVEAF